eukprot:UN32636
MNTCNCSNGTAATGSICTSNGASICVSCSSGYSLSGGSCVSSGTVVVPGYKSWGTDEHGICTTSESEGKKVPPNLSKGTQGNQVSNADCMSYCTGLAECIGYSMHDTGRCALWVDSHDSGLRKFSTSSWF